MKTKQPKSLFVVTSTNGEYLARCGRLDVAFDPFLHLFRDARTAWWYCDSSTGFAGNGKLAVREVALALTVNTSPAPRPKK
jgi:hypothetical protein